MDRLGFRIHERLSSSTVGPVATAPVTPTTFLHSLIGSSGRPAQLGRRAEPAKLEFELQAVRPAELRRIAEPAMLDSDIQAWLVRPTPKPAQSSYNSYHPFMTASERLYPPYSGAMPMHIRL